MYCVLRLAQPHVADAKGRCGKKNYKNSFKKDQLFNYRYIQYSFLPRIFSEKRILKSLLEACYTDFVTKWLNVDTKLTINSIILKGDPQTIQLRRDVKIFFLFTVCDLQLILNAGRSLQGRLIETAPQCDLFHCRQQCQVGKVLPLMKKGQCLASRAVQFHSMVLQ